MEATAIGTLVEIVAQVPIGDVITYLDGTG